MIEKLTLNNFRCFQDFTLEGIAPVTLIAGKNGVGKSSVLESLFLFANRNSSEVFFKLNQFRGIHLVGLLPEALWEPIFRETNKPLALSLTNGGREQTLTFSKDDTEFLASVPKIPLPPNAQEPIRVAYPLKQDYRTGDLHETAHFVLTEAGVLLSRQTQQSAKTPLTWLTPLPWFFPSKWAISTQLSAEWLGKLDMNGQRQKGVAILQKLDPRIKDLSVIVIGGTSGIYADIGLASKLSVNLISDGLHKLMTLILAMLVNPGALILVDEIENGFHYSFFPTLWTIIKELVRETGCQVFATTHSRECIVGARELAQDETLFRFIRLDREKERIAAKPFDSDSFEYACEHGFEMR